MLSVQKSFKIVPTAVVPFLRITRVMREFRVKVRVNHILNPYLDLSVISLWFCVFFRKMDLNEGFWWRNLKFFDEFIRCWRGLLRPERRIGLATLEKWLKGKKYLKIIKKSVFSFFIEISGLWFSKKSPKYSIFLLLDVANCFPDRVSVKKVIGKHLCWGSSNRAFTP